MSTYKEPLIVVIGGAGYVGSWTIRTLLKLGYRVRAYDNFLFGHEGIDDIINERFQMVEGDLCDVTAVSRAVHGADCVILLASLIGRRFTETIHARFREVNFLGSSVALDASIEHGVSRFIYVSSDCVYGEQSGIMYETTTPEPVSLYARLKLRVEERVIRKKSRYFHPTALRLATCYGYSPRMRFDLVPNTLIRDAVCQGRIEISTPDACRAFLHVEDAAEAICACVRAHINLISGEVFNVGSNEQNASIKQLGNFVRSVCPEVDIVLKDEEPDLVDYRLSCSKIERMLDFTPKWSIEQSLSRLKHMLNENHFGDPYHLRYYNT